MSTPNVQRYVSFTDKKIMKKTGKILITSELAREYGFKDIGGNLFTC